MLVGVSPSFSEAWASGRAVQVWRPRLLLSE